MRISVLKALKQRDFALLWTGQTISLFGDGIFSVALAWQALELDSGAGGLGFVLVVRSVVRVATLLFGGALADRYSKRLLMLFGDAVQLISITWLTFLVGSGDAQLWHLAVVAVAVGIGGGLFLSSSSAIVPELVPEDHYRSANSLRSTGMLLASQLVGPATGGVLVAALGTTIAFGIDAATFLASIVALLLIRPRRLERAGERTRLVSDVREGLSYVRRTPWLWVSMIVVGAASSLVLFGPLPVLIPLIVQDKLQAGADTLGLVMAGYGLGGVAGALFMGSRELKLRSVKPAYFAWATGCVFMALVGLAPNALMAAAAFAAMGFIGNCAEVIWVTLEQTYVPTRLLGRVTSADWLIALSMQPVGLALAAPAAAAFGPGPTLVVGALISAAAICLGLLHPGVNQLGKPVEAQG